MLFVKYKPCCPHCRGEVPIEVNLINGDMRQLTAKPKADRAHLAAVVAKYRELKGYTDDRQPNWTRVRGPWAFGQAKLLLLAFGALQDPVGVAIECMIDTEAKARLEGWSWTLGTVVKRADEWLAQKQKGGARR